MTFEQAYDNYYNMVYKAVYMRLLNREDTEDVVQETFIKAMKAWDSLKTTIRKIKTMTNNKQIEKRLEWRL